MISNVELAAEGFVWGAMVTSARSSSSRHDVPISDLADAGLSAPSVARPVKLACIEPRRIVRRAGRLLPIESQRALAAVSGFIGKSADQKAEA